VSRFFREQDSNDGFAPYSSPLFISNRIARASLFALSNRIVNEVELRTFRVRIEGLRLAAMFQKAIEDEAKRWANYLILNLKTYKAGYE
jgi:hypothetical protein